ncbi:hypothetical protein QUA93_10845 [Microcoleus sp. F10-B6]
MRLIGAGQLEIACSRVIRFEIQDLRSNYLKSAILPLKFCGQMPNMGINSLKL